ncbi:hypothetical protein [Mycolicibacterium canariasense]|nr:hypothetical protein [Mycolicibacterium canariasense]
MLTGSAPSGLRFGFVVAPDAHRDVVIRALRPALREVRDLVTW